jgi:hypothetical protein
MHQDIKKQYSYLKWDIIKFAGIKELFTQKYGGCLEFVILLFILQAVINITWS